MVKSGVYHHKKPKTWIKADIRKASDAYHANLFNKNVNKIAREFNVARKQNEAEKVARKSQVEVDRQTRRGNIVSGVIQVKYGGALGPKNMEDLRNIMWGLRLKEEGIKADYIMATKDHLDSHPDLQDHPHWAGLYHQGQQHQQASGMENVPPLPAQASTSTAASPTPSLAARSHYLDSVPYLSYLRTLSIIYSLSIVYSLSTFTAHEIL